MKIKKAGPFLWILLATGALAACASANSIPVSGGGYANNAQNASGFSISGPGVSVIDNNPGGAFDAFCTLGSFCSIGAGVSGVVSFAAYPGLSSADFAGRSANVIGGGLSFSGGVFVPASYDPYQQPLVVPGTVTGTIQGYWFVCVPGNCDGEGVLLWTLNISGTGMGTFYAPDGWSPGPGGFVDFQAVDFDFSGTATHTPEPSTLLLLGTGLLAILGLAKAGRRAL
ncbi:MAG TPA: PEP-CTERM sorting domain-containing protein [Candidatus Acidoferrales bacterium]|nr:PEP-CTERM sorting domain-containing protein [Candidatus Acidoferrales bacterium]